MFGNLPDFISYFHHEKWRNSAWYTKGYILRNFLQDILNWKFPATAWLHGGQVVFHDIMLAGTNDIIVDDFREKFLV